MCGDLVGSKDPDKPYCAVQGDWCRGGRLRSGIGCARRCTIMAWWERRREEGLEEIETFEAVWYGLAH
jgi:hypothetical protein